jgi:hypothetical protein
MFSSSRADARRLRYLMNVAVEGFANIPKDRYDYACEHAAKQGREEANELDELNGFRQMIDDAMIADAEVGNG